MLPWSDGLPARRFPVVNVLLIVANVAVFILYELPNMAEMRIGLVSGKIRIAIIYQH